tara:strand:+ start:68 stop:358 length:291 start_codon:yes stop_codon:yes gene_type:complete
MPIDNDIVKRIGELARIELSVDEIQKFSRQLGQIVDLMNQLDEVDTSSVQDKDVDNSKAHNSRPKDTVTDGDCIDSILKNAPESKEGFFTVKKVIE